MTQVRVVMLALSLSVSCLALGCSQEQPPPLEVSDVEIFVPVPGSEVSAAYMSVRNNTDRDMTITRFASPLFDAVEVHETTSNDGIMRMLAHDNLRVSARSSVTLREGGMHLMLLRPGEPLEVGKRVTISLTDTTGNTVLVSAPLQSRVDID